MESHILICKVRISPLGLGSFLHVVAGAQDCRPTFIPTYKAHISPSRSVCVCVCVCAICSSIMQCVVVIALVLQPRDVSFGGDIGNNNPSFLPKTKTSTIVFV